MAPRFLSTADVLYIHKDLIREFGGTHGLRDLGLLEAALGMASSGSGGDFFHGFPFEMAAAYAFHIVRNHPFLDGNKRAAFAVSLTFLEINGFAVMGGERELERAIRATADRRMGKKALAEVFATAHKKSR